MFNQKKSLMKILQYVFFFLAVIVVGCSNDPEEVINDFKKGIG